MLLDIKTFILPLTPYVIQDGVTHEEHKGLNGGKTKREVLTLMSKFPLEILDY